MSLTQAEADYLMKLKKVFENPKTIAISNNSPLSYKFSLTSSDERENFILTVWRGSNNLQKYTLQELGRVSVVLVRLDIGGSPHRNPDGKEIKCPHIHYYREGDDDKWAFPLPHGKFTNTSDVAITLKEFANLCNIDLPKVQGEMI